MASSWLVASQKKRILLHPHSILCPPIQSSKNVKKAKLLVTEFPTTHKSWRIMEHHLLLYKFWAGNGSLEARENVLWNIGHDWTHRLQGLPVSSIPMFPYNPYIFLNIFCQAGVDPNIGVTKAETQNQFKRHTRLTLHFANASCWIWSDGHLSCLRSQQVLSSIVPSAPWCYFLEDRITYPTYPMTDGDWYIYLHFSAITDIIYIDPMGMALFGILPPPT